MAGGGNSEDNPVELNVTAMVDIIFCLCLFFMCSFHFKQLQGRIDSWLPKDVGVNAGTPENVLLEEIRVIIRYEQGQGTITKLGSQKVASMQELGDLLLQSYGDYEKVGKTKSDVPIIIDAFPEVPWKDVINVMNAAKVRGLEKIQFAAPIPTLPGG